MSHFPLNLGNLDLCIHELFQSQVEQISEDGALLNPDPVAVVFGDQQLTYCQLNYRANQLAHYLQSLGVGPEVLVGVYIERSLEMVVGLLGILKAGGAYVPLDPGLPLERLAFMLEDAQVPIMLTQEYLARSLPKNQTRIVCLDRDREVIAQQNNENLMSGVTPDNLAYTIYTSGSTGSPKGVQIPHRAAVNFLNSMRLTPGMTAQDRLLAVTTITFDIAGLELFLPLSVGARVVIVSRELASDGVQLSNALRASGATVMQATPATWQLLFKSGWRGNKQLKVLCGGEALPQRLANQLLENCASVWNLYGPTETTIWSTLYQLGSSPLPIAPNPQRGPRVPHSPLPLIPRGGPEFPTPSMCIGRPIANTQVYLLNAQMEIVPMGDSGEVYIGGAGLARGYLNRPDLTAERFIPNPFENSEFQRLYKTGDLARYLRDGNIEYVGRIDHQVKIRGFRIELGEIETVLEQHPAVENAVVVVREDMPGDKRLVTYIVSNLFPDRIPYQSTACAEVKGKCTFNLTTEDISSSGVCLVGVPVLWNPGETVHVRLLLPGVSIQQWFEGKIAWRQGKRAGIQFALTPTEQAIFNGSIEYLQEEQGFLKMLERALFGNLRSFLKEKLPDYMIPSNFVFLRALPLTPNGKVNRQALPIPSHTRPEVEEDFAAPCTPVQAALAEIWAPVLGLERIGIHDNFLELGGHSLLATQIISRVRETYQVELPVRELFERPTIADLAESITLMVAENQSLQVSPIQPICRDFALLNRDGSRGFPLSFAQEQLWFLNQLVPENPFYNVVEAVRLSGLLNVTTLERSFQEIIQRHETLRTTFTTVDGQPVQVIHDSHDFRLSVINLQEFPQIEREAYAQELATQEAQHLFNLSQEPLLRVTLLQLDEQESILLLNLHHILCDDWSLSVLFAELTALEGTGDWRLGAGDWEEIPSHQYPLPTPHSPLPTPHSPLPTPHSPLPKLAIQYADYAIWQRRWLQEKVLERQISYWQQQLAGLPILQLPTDHPRPLVPTYRGALLPLVLPKTLTVAIKALSQEEGVTLFMTLLAAFVTLLFRYTNAQDIPVGSAIANRHLPNVEGLIGFFVNTVVLRTDVSGSPSFKELLVRVREVALAAYTHQDLPFDKLVAELQPERDLSRQPLFQVVFALQNLPPSADLKLAGLKTTSVTVDNKTAKFDLFLQLSDTPQGLTGWFEYSTDLFDAATISCMAGHFQTLLEGIVADPERRLLDLPLLSEGERSQLLVEWNQTQVDYPLDACIHQLFEAQVAENPDVVAVVCDWGLGNAPCSLPPAPVTHITYGELNCRANQLANHLRTLGVKPEVVVGICVERSLEMIVGILGILKAGGAYLPLDPRLPKERLAFIFEDSRVSLLLTQERLVKSLPQHQMDVILLDKNWEVISLESRDNPISGVTPDNLTYVIYTSGSTGSPKGVLLEHRGLCNLAVQQKLFDVQPSSRILQFASFGFDASVFEIFMTLAVGATLLLSTQDDLMPGQTLIRLLREQAITTVILSPSVLAVLPTEDLPALRTIIVAGEACSPDLVVRWASGRRFFNAYGPTEATICTTVADSTFCDKKPPIGRPIGNMRCFLLNAQLQPVPVGVPGELYISGCGVARGYLNRSDLTAERFISNPFANKPGERLYKTGDLARYLPDGNMIFIGRIDHQIKLRGFRIELNEIEVVLRQHPAVQMAAIVEREDVPNQKRLVAYVVLAGNSGSPLGIRGDGDWVPLPNRQSTQFPGENEYIIIHEMRYFLEEKLPDYMIPSAFVLLDALPVTPNGKLDRSALPAPKSTLIKPEEEMVVDLTLVEKQLVSIWTQVLGIEKIGINENFFELGGNSLLGAQLIAYVRKTFSVELPMRCLFEKPTVEGLAQIIQTLHQKGISAITTVIDFHAEAVLAPEIFPQSTLDDISEPRHIFLTGATGFVGANMLHELLEQTQAKIYCLVRSANESEGAKRLQKSLEKYLLWNPNQSSRIIPTIGDLARPLLGLSAEQFERLALEIDTIYHNGAQVNFVEPYSTIKAANVGGTHEVLRLACMGKVKPVHYISTCGIYGPISYFTGIKVINEEDDIDIAEDYLCMDVGYTQSKWVAEKIVHIAKSRKLPVSIYRLGFVMGNTRTGVANTDDYMSRIIKGCIQLGSYPDLIDQKEEFVSVDYVTKAILHLSHQKESLGKTFHVVPLPDQSMDLISLFELISSLGYQLKKIPYTQWKNELIEQTQHSQENALYPLVPMLVERVYQDSLTIMQLYQSTPVFDCRNTLLRLAGTSIACPLMDDKLLKTYFSYFTSSGFLGAPHRRRTTRDE